MISRLCSTLLSPPVGATKARSPPRSQSVSNHLAVLEATFVAHVLKPFSSRRATEIIAAPKVYAFDTGFLCHYFDARNLLAFRQAYPKGENFAVGQDVALTYRRATAGHDVHFVNLAGLIARLQAG